MMDEKMEKMLHILRVVKLVIALKALRLHAYSEPARSSKLTVLVGC
jgi:hypothetical protein